MFEHRIVKNCCPELFKGCVEKIVEVSDDLEESSLIGLVVHKRRVECF